MLNPQLNISALKQAFAQHGVLSIQNILQEDVARELNRILINLSWNVEIKDYEKSKVFRIPLEDAPNPDNLLTILDECDHGLNRERLFFMRLCVNAEEFTHPYLVEFSEFMNTDAFLESARQITGKSEITHTWIEATRYDRSCFLGGHRDDHHPGNLIALVLNLTPHWQLDWGGLLMVQKADNMPPFIVPPIWNSLNMLTVPVDHLVSSVSPAAMASRYSLTGWFRP